MKHLLLLSLIAGCAGGYADPERRLGPEVTGPADGVVEIHQPPTLGVVDTPLRDVHGASVGVACATCHGPDADGAVLAEARGNPEGMHQSVELVHGTLTCGSCHDPDDRRFLRLADGRRLELEEAMDLCGQCHGVQLRDYRHGSHGGMTGHWDLRRGDRSRNHCLDCHGAHDPAYPQLEPVFPPRDRGTVQSRVHAPSSADHPSSSDPHDGEAH